MSSKLNLLEDASATGAVGVFDGGKARFTVVGTLDGATVSLQALGPDGVTYVNMSAGLSAEGSEVLDLPAGSYRAAVTGGTTPSGLYANLIQV